MKCPLRGESGPPVTELAPAEPEPWEESYSPTAPSRVTHVAQCVVFGAVMADAAMRDSVLEMDVWESERGADGRPRHDG